MARHLRTDSGSLPRRIDSLIANKAPIFTDIEDELRDIKRVHSQGQEEDLKMALSRMISRVEDLTFMLKEAYKAQTDLQTELTLAKSNLQLALANNEMLEDALKREGHVKDVGWRRASARERELQAEEDRRRSMDSIASSDTALSPVVSPPSPAIPPSSRPSSPKQPNVSTATSPLPSSEGRFFRFRFGAGSASTNSFPSSPRLAGPSGHSPLTNGTAHASHLTSASLPSLVAVPDRQQEIDELTAELKRERDARQAAVAQKEAVESELESLSQALFEEANRMVSTERRKLAETVDELKELQAEREALRNALRLVESQNRASQYSTPAGSPKPSHAHKLSASSARAIKSLPPTRPSSPEGEEDPTSASTIITSYQHRPPPITIVDPASPAPPSSPSAESSDDDSRDTTLVAPPSSLSVGPSPSLSSSSSPSPSPKPSPMSDKSEGSDYAFPIRMHPLDYLPGEPSPWADATSLYRTTTGS
ncbi:uncharacterized protein C8Q71DRAFT_894053 [Rhodofomes roseus]|uniref:GDP/GTP exchange factor Sec2 N-terminal domain-containing protein n=1 Tax=Rhodofomes roseus TaxID=34475 RepID=A0ABQ8KL76_9APHY|nr:uncharacterized protein C8Q71DRAFT_894053 [Rhodofomes roseus]KAH9839074.1 hypothetical protein C8Q71DRAFT_894053 [Rhodofomes roseus]